jgi:hypothetical protein
VSVPLLILLVWALCLAQIVRVLLYLLDVVLVLPLPLWPELLCLFVFPF